MKMHAAAWTGRWMIGGALCGVLAALVVFAPASWLALGAARASEGKVLLDAPRGTVWDGSAQLVLSGGAASKGAFSLPSRLHWRIAPVWLGFDLSLHAPCCASAASPVLIGLRSASWHINSTGLQLPVDMLAGLGAPWNTLQFSGNLRFSANQLTGTWSPNQDPGPMSGQASLEATDVATALSTVRPLGSYRLTSASEQLQLTTIQTAGADSAALQLSGRGQVTGGRVSFDGEAMASKGYEEALSNLLHIVGQWQPSPDGRSRSILKL